MPSLSFYSFPRHFVILVVVDTVDVITFIIVTFTIITIISLLLLVLVLLHDYCCYYYYINADAAVAASIAFDNCSTINDDNYNGDDDNRPKMMIKIMLLLRIPSPSFTPLFRIIPYPPNLPLLLFFPISSSSPSPPSSFYPSPSSTSPFPPFLSLPYSSQHNSTSLCFPSSFLLSNFEPKTQESPVPRRIKRGDLSEINARPFLFLLLKEVEKKNLLLRRNSLSLNFFG